MTSNNDVLDIAEVVRRTGVPASTLRVWESKNLLKPHGRSGIRRQYSADVIERIAVIVVCQRSGFSLAETSQLLQPDAFVDGKGRLAQKVTELKRHRDELNQAIEGIEHALSCTHPNPLRCPSFRSKLTDVLPRTPRDSGNATHSGR